MPRFKHRRDWKAFWKATVMGVFPKGVSSSTMLWFDMDQTLLDHDTAHHCGGYTDKSLRESNMADFCLEVFPYERDPRDAWVCFRPGVVELFAHIQELNRKFKEKDLNAEIRVGFWTNMDADSAREILFALKTKLMEDRGVFKEDAFNWSLIGLSREAMELRTRLKKHPKELKYLLDPKFPESLKCEAENGSGSATCYTTNVDGLQQGDTKEGNDMRNTIEMTKETLKMMRDGKFKSAEDSDNQLTEEQKNLENVFLFDDFEYNCTCNSDGCKALNIPEYHCVDQDDALTQFVAFLKKEVQATGFLEEVHCQVSKMDEKKVDEAATGFLEEVNCQVNKMAEKKVDEALKQAITEFPTYFKELENGKESNLVPKESGKKSACSKCIIC